MCAGKMSKRAKMSLSAVCYFKLQMDQNSFSFTHDAPPDSIVCWGGEHPLPIPFCLEALIRRLDLGASVVTPTQIPGYAYDSRL